jgi:ribonuclease J
MMNIELGSAFNSQGIIVFPIGGCGEFGKNMTGYVVDGRLFVVDAGLLFADSRSLGVASVIPDVTEIFKKFGGPTAYIITHGHEDHIGALPFICRDWPALIYATPWTCRLIEGKFDRHGLQGLKGSIRKVNAGDIFTIGKVKFEYLHVNHSIPDACAVIIDYKGTKILHTGDFKVDLKCEECPPIRLEEYSRHKDITLMLADSTNASHAGIGPGEAEVVEPLRKAILECKGRTIISTFASNLWRLQIVVKLAKELGKKVLVSGTGIDNCLKLAEELGHFKWPDGVKVSPEHLKKVEDRDLIILATGCQAENRASLYKMAYGEHRDIKIMPNDSVIISARTIPGNEKDVASLISELRRLGAHVITTRSHPGIHVSGHAYAGEIRLLLEAANPKYFMPVHGTYAQICDNQILGNSLRFQTIIPDNGAVLEVHKDKGVRQIGDVDVPLLYVDGESSALLHYETIRERLRVGELGGVIISGIIDVKKGLWAKGPTLESLGLMNESRKKGLDEFGWAGELLDEVKAWGKSLKVPPTDADVSEVVRVAVRRKLSNEFRKKPVVVSNIWLL